MKKIKKLFAAVAMSLAVMTAAVPVAGAQEDNRVVLRPGDGISYSSADPAPGWCSIAAIGRDNQSRLVALTAGHCEQAGTANVYKVGAQSAGPIGKESNVFSAGSTDFFGFPTDAKADYSVLVLDETKVRGSNTSEIDAEGQSVTISGIKTFTKNGSQNIGAVCSAGFTTKIHCSNSNQGVIVDNNLLQAYPSVQNGDSGGALVDANGQLVGITVGYRPAWPPNTWQRMDKVAADLNAKGGAGAGFIPISTP